MSVESRVAEALRDLADEVDQGILDHGQALTISYALQDADPVPDVINTRDATRMLTIVLNGARSLEQAL